jgi:ABC-type transport system substrate-binding protein
MPEGSHFGATGVVGAVVAVAVVLAVAGPAPAAPPTCFGIAATIVGTDGDDVLTGTPGVDYVYAGGGNDEVRAGDDNDLVCGGAGDDRLFGGAGADRLRGEAGNDWIFGGVDGPNRNADTVDFFTAPGGVTVDLEAGTAAGEGTDRLSGIEWAIGSPFDDDLFGSSGDNILSGGAGNDLLMGFGGGDSLSAGPGDDTLRGGAASDLLTGMQGIDVCVEGESLNGCERGGGTLRVDLSSNIDYVDPALATFLQSWQLMNATCVRLVTHPDASGLAGSVLVPDGAVALPVTSPNGLRYTFTVNQGLRFSPPSNEAVTAATFKRALERVLDPGMQSPGSRYISDIVGAEAYRSGQATEVSGIVARGMKLTIQLVEPRGDFLARLALPYFCAVPSDAPIDPAGAQLPSAGPYYVLSWNQFKDVVAVRNPNYRGRRASDFDRIEWTMNVAPANSVARVEAGESDVAQTVLAADRQRLHETNGPGSPAAAAGRQSYFVEPALVDWFLALNTSRRAFKDRRLRRAVAYALNRVELAALHGYDGGFATDQILPMTLAGFRDDDVFPLIGDVAMAKSLAAAAGVTPETPIDVVMYSFNATFGPAVAEYVKNALAPLGINVTVQLFDRVTQHQKQRTPGEPFDIGLEGWGADYNDPQNFLHSLLHGSSLPPPGYNVSYFTNAKFDARLDAAAELPAPQRYPAYADLDRDLSTAAPIVPYVNTSSVMLFSDRIGCHRFMPHYRIALNALCLR